MNRTEFIQLIQDPDLPATRHVGALKQVMADFPYFTVSQVLLAKALHNEKHYEYEKYLKQTALTVPDREVLYYYLHNTAAPELLPVTEVQPPAPVVAPVIIPEPPVEPPVIIEQAVPEIPTETVTENEIYAETTAIETEIPVEEPVIITEEAALPVVPAPVQEEVLPPESQMAEPLSEMPLNDTSALTEESEEHSFMEWLMLKSGQPVPSDDTPPVITKPAANVEPVLADPEPVVESPAYTEPAKTPVIVEVTKADIEQAVAKSNVNDFGNILDKFIKENPSISRPKAEFFNPVNMAKQSVEEDEELVTETLANLLYKQGNLKKAIRAYEKLCLLYPSKMTYFASLIQKIKTELKD